MIDGTIRERVSKIRVRVMKSNPFTSHRSDLIFVLDQLEWCFGIVDALLESQERIAKDLVEYRQKTLQTYEHNGILIRERDNALARAEDAEERMQLFESNVAGSLKKLREEKLAHESALRTAGQRIEELVRERDARAKISPQMARDALNARTTIDGFDFVIGALREHAEKVVP
jgi:hypothetical protein